MNRVIADETKSLPTATSELHALLALPTLASVPLLVLANKNDLPGAVGVDDLIADMRLGEIGTRVVSVSRPLPPVPLALWGPLENGVNRVKQF